MMTANNFLEVTLRPTLVRINMWSPEAEKLLLMIACHESQGFKHLRQVAMYENGEPVFGPARSYFQIEPQTLFDLYTTYLQKRQGLHALISAYERQGIPLEDNLLDPDQQFAVVAARLILWRRPEPIPAGEGFDNDVALAHYAKRFWNTVAGSASAQKYLDDYLRYKPTGYGE